MSAPNVSRKSLGEQKLTSISMAVRFAAAVLGRVVCLQAVEPTGEQIYEQARSGCHDGGESRAPTFDVLCQLSPYAIPESLRDGVTAYVGETLADGQVEIHPVLGPRCGGAAKLEAAKLPGC